MRLWKSLTGMMKVELTSAEPEITLSEVNEAGIEVFDVSFVNDLTREFRIMRTDFSAVRKIALRRGDSLKTRQYLGLFWKGKRLLLRPALILGISMILILTMYLPSRILFIRVEGNQTISTRKILESAEECGIRFGSSRRGVRSEQIKNALLYAVPELQWVGVNTSGCIATILVRERTGQDQQEQHSTVSSIVADRDGYIISMTAARGNALCRPGQSVKRGQTLISGYTDCGICIQAVRAEGEVYALTQRDLYAITPAHYLARSMQRKAVRSYSLIYQKKRINLWKDSGIWDTTCDRIVKTYSLSLPGKFVLPISFCVEEISSYEVFPSSLPQPQAEHSLLSFAQSYLVEQMVAGTIHSAQVKTSFTDGAYHFVGSFICEEMIGRERSEKHSR